MYKDTNADTDTCY